MNTAPRVVVAALQISLDGYIQGADGDVAWVDSWNESRDLVPDVDAAVIGGGTYQGYEQLWGSIAADPSRGAAMMGREITAGEVEYARWTQRTPHYVLSTTLEKVEWETAHLLRDVSELRSLTEQPGGAIYVVGGASLVSSLLKAGLIDELRLIVHPVLLGGGKSPFAGVSASRPLELVSSTRDASGRAVLAYRI